MRILARTLHLELFHFTPEPQRKFPLDNEQGFLTEITIELGRC